jgi:cytochrome c biogenesis protein CcmG/thiol:disulfide interchange protein DsbE
MRRHVIMGLAVTAAVGALVGIVLLSGGAGGVAGTRAPELPREVLVPPKVTLGSLEGGPAAINFWASWCDPCRKEAPELERLAESLPGRARLVGVNWVDDRSAARSFVDEHGWAFPNLRDADGRVGNEYELNGLPMTFILDSQGRIAEVLRGPQTEPSLREALESAG